MTETVLVVDDVDTNRKVLRQILDLKGYSVIEATDGQTAIDAYSANNPDLILMDINMPGMDGKEAANRIKKFASATYTPIIFVTALSAESALATALDSGGDDFISKPVNVPMLESKIRAHLRIRELNLQLEKKNQELVEHNERLKYEQQLVEHYFDRALQQSYLDTRYIRHYMSSMSAFNGDLLLAQRAPNGDIFVIVGDFTGHGLTAAMGTLPVTQVFFNHTSAHVSLPGLVREINLVLERLLPTQLFFAANVMQLAKDGSRLALWSSGMPDAYWMDKGGNLKQVIVPAHTPLGVVKDNEFDDTVQTFETEIGEQFYFCSDGVTEARNPEGEMFGRDRLRQCLEQNGSERIDHVLSDLHKFRNNDNQDDDITLVEITCKNNT